jgi:hypothetical protein
MLASGPERRFGEPIARHLHGLEVGRCGDLEIFPAELPASYIAP